MTATEDAIGGNLGAGLELPVMRGEWQHVLQLACCSHVAESMHMLPCPTPAGTLASVSDNGLLERAASF